MSCEIIIVVWNKLKETQACLESVIKKTKLSCRLILIDNASEEKTALFLKTFAQRYDTKVILIRNKTNLGFIKAVNHGLEQSKADFVCLLNNDTIVTEDWLEELIFVAAGNPKIGLVNPSSTTLGQKTTLDKIDAFALSFKKYHGQFEEMAQASGFCMLIKREVIQKIGGFDEIYGLGNFEDTDYSRSAVKAGFLCVRAIASYVYHHEGTSFFSLKGYKDSFKKNQAVFYNRWGRPKRIFVQAGKGLKPSQTDKLLSLAGKGHWIVVAKEKKTCLPAIKHSNIKIISFHNWFFEINCFFRIMKKLKKRYDYIVFQSKFLSRMLALFKIINKLHLIDFKELEGLPDGL